VIKKPRERGGHIPRWAAEPEIIIIIIIIVIIIIIIINCFSSTYDWTCSTIYSKMCCEHKNDKNLTNIATIIILEVSEMDATGK
jgi:hypothetical protein